MRKPVVLLVVSLLILSPFVNAQTDGPPRLTVDHVVIHTIGGPSCRGATVVYPGIKGDAKRWIAYFKAHEVIGIHYVIGRDGETLSGISEEQVAYHAYGNNLTSIGIELVNNGDGSDPFPPEQINALIELLRDICSRRGLSVDKVRGHEEIDGRWFQCGPQMFKEKVDPGRAFPWREVREALAQRFPAR